MGVALMHEAMCRKLVKVRSSGLCERCGRQGHTMHHRKNRSQGGDWVPTNIVHLCGDGTQGCHGFITEHPLVAHREGFHVKSWEDPAEMPLQSWRGTVLLTDVPVMPSIWGGTTVSSFTPDDETYAQVDKQDHWLPANPD